jgi:hypothetical protein
VAPATCSAPRRGVDNCGLADPRFVAVADLADALNRLKDAYADLDKLEAEFRASGGSSRVDHSAWLAMKETS